MSGMRNDLNYVPTVGLSWKEVKQMGTRTFTGPLSYSSKDGVTSVGLGDVVNQFHDEHSLAHSGTAKQT